MGNKLGAPPGGGGGGGGGGTTGTGNGTPEGAGTTAESASAGKPGDTSHSTHHSSLLRPGGPAGSGAVVNGVMSEPTVAGGGGPSGDPEAEGLADVPPPMMPIKASIPLSATATSVAAAVDENVSDFSIAYR